MVIEKTLIRILQNVQIETELEYLFFSHTINSFLNYKIKFDHEITDWQNEPEM